MESLLRAGGLMLLLLATGCASVTGSNVQKMYVQTQAPDGSALADAECVLSNDKGRWTLRSPGDASVVRSNKPMEVKCTKPSQPDGGVSLESGTRAAMFGNILVGGIVGAAIDHSSGAAYEYPEQVHVVMGQMKKVAWVAGGPSGPPATNYAAISDFGAVPYLGPKGREAYQLWITRPNPKAFAIAPDGHFRATWGTTPQDRMQPTDPLERALQLCEQAAKMPCKLYAVNDSVVWVAEGAPAAVRSAPTAKPAPAPASIPVSVPAPASPAAPVTPHLATGYAAIDDIDAIPYLSDRGREDYRQWLTRPTPKAFAIASTGQWFGAWSLKPLDPTHPTDPTERALLVCAQRAQMPCKLYAINGAVVWPKETRAGSP